VIAKCISFANMDENEFQEVYDKVLTVLLRRVFPGMFRAEIDELVDRYLSFA
jgi:hypothetical protein